MSRDKAFTRNLGRIHDMLQKFHSCGNQLNDSLQGFVDLMISVNGREMSLCCEKPEAYITRIGTQLAVVCRTPPTVG